MILYVVVKIFELLNYVRCLSCMLVKEIEKKKIIKYA